MKKIICIFLLSLCCFLITSKNRRALSKDFSYKDITPQQHAEIENLIKDVSSTLNLFYKKLSKCTPYKITGYDGEILQEVYGLNNGICRTFLDGNYCYFPDGKYQEYAKNSKKMLSLSVRGKITYRKYEEIVQKLNNQYCKSASPKNLLKNNPIE